MRRFVMCGLITMKTMTCGQPSAPGCRIKQILQKLNASADLTMPSIGLITQQTIAGAIATATHGSGRYSLSHYTTEIRVAAYDPETGARIYSWNNGPELRAARCTGLYGRRAFSALAACRSTT